MKIFNVVLFVLLTALILVLMVVAYYLGSLSRSNEPMPSSIGEVVGGAVDSVSQGADGAASESGGSVTDSVPAAGFTVSLSSLPEAQQSMLRTLGYEDSITFTPEMVACAEGKLGSARVGEIKAGAVPGPLEAASLMPCF